MSKKNNYLKNEIKVILKKERKKYIKILVKDNGVGIEKENLSNIFSYGYTNKENGHGFGLHSCALFAKEMGGSLEVTSAGADKGATFTLTLPVNME
jgi:signal transduction histidine kinase